MCYTCLKLIIISICLKFKISWEIVIIPGPDVNIHFKWLWYVSDLKQTLYLFKIQSIHRITFYPYSTYLSHAVINVVSQRCQFCKLIKTDIIVVIHMYILDIVEIWCSSLVPVSLYCQSIFLLHDISYRLNFMILEEPHFDINFS